MIKLLVLAVNLLIIACSTPAMAEALDRPCKQIPKNNERLKCYDQMEQINSQALTGTVLDERISQEMASLDNSFSLTAHRPTYLLPIAYMSSPNETPYSPLQGEAPVGTSLDNLEVKYQISLRVPLNRDFFIKGSDLWFGYTQLSLWQLYNSNASAPFRETNYEPEIIWLFLMNKSFGKLKLTHLAPALNHQSNGRSDPLSRSWNRITFDSIWAYEDWVFSFKPWYRLPDSDGDDDNEDIEDYMGNFELILGKKDQDHTYSAMFRSNLDKDEPHNFYELGYSFSINRRFRGYIQFISGYGESLIDYNHRNKRFSIGIMLNDWF